MQDFAGTTYLTTAEVAAYLRLKERTIYDLVARQAIPCSRVTGKLIFPRRLVDQWVEAHVDLAGSPVGQPPPIMAGSSDPLLEWALRESGCGIASLFEGSGKGLARFAARETLAVGLHLLDDGGMGYNIDALGSLGPVSDLVLIRWAEREQGLIVARGNPLGLCGLSSLVATKARVVSRQEGSGGRLLLARLLERAEIDAADLNCLAQPALTEGDVAVAIADGEADCGLAVGAAAKRLGLGFVPLHRECFDIACRRRDYFDPPLQALFAFARSPALATKAEALGGYSTQETGTIQFNG